MNIAPQKTLFDLVVDYETTKRLEENIFYNQDDLVRLIDYFEQELLYQEALDVVEKAIEIYPYTVEFLFRKVHLFIFSDCPESALKALHKAELLVPGSFDVKLHKAWVFADLGLFNESAAILKDLQNKIINKKDLSLVYFYEALVQERKGEMNKTYQTLRKAIELDPTNKEALEKMWWCINRLSYQEQNIELFQKVVNEDPYSWWGWFNLGTGLEYACRYEEAIEAYEFAMVIDPNKDLAFRYCAEVCFNVNKYDAALRYFEEYSRKFQADADIYLKIATCYLQLDKITAAKKFLFMAIDENEFNEEVYFYLGECCQKEGDFPNAILYYKKAINLYPLREELFKGLGKTYFKMNKPEHARKYFQRMVDIGPDILDCWKTYIEFLYQINELENAVKVIDEASVFHDCSSLKYYKVAYQVAMGKMAEAKYYLGEALEEDFHGYRFLFEAEPRLSKMNDITGFISEFEQKRHSFL